MATARAWCRVDLAGGTLDIWPLGLLHPGASTVNVAIDVAVEARVEPGLHGYEVIQGQQRCVGSSAAELQAQPDAALAGLVAAALDLPPFTATLSSGSPRGGGLGASSAMTVALLSAAEHAFGFTPSSVERRAALARDLEARLMSLPTGTQDHYPALLGGALQIFQRPGGAVVERLAIDADALAASLLVAYTGQSHFSAGQNWAVVRRRLDGDPRIVELLDGIAATANHAALALMAGDLAALGAAMTAEWRLRSQLAEGISTPTVEHLLATALAGGAWGGKACGAGGGGCVAVLCPPALRQEVTAAMAAAGGQILPARPTLQPLEVL
jgi:D-glycero-alpha-D-manno-heptose-7-phosphate kinase